MRCPRIYVKQLLAVDAEVALDPGAAEHVARVLRMRIGDALVLFNGDGKDYAAELTTVERRVVRARITAVVDCTTEGPFPLLLAQALARGDKMDLVVQKAVELGVSGLVPLVTERSNVRLDQERAARRVERWQAVATSACEQCGRARIPDIAPVQALDDWCGSLTGNALRLALVPGAGKRIRELSIPASGVVLAVGPEGGLSGHDLDTLHAAGFADISLGPRTLRTETAGLTALAALQAVHGDV